MLVFNVKQIKSYCANYRGTKLLSISVEMLKLHTGISKVVIGITHYLLKCYTNSPNCGQTLLNFSTGFPLQSLHCCNLGIRQNHILRLYTSERKVLEQRKA